MERIYISLNNSSDNNTNIIIGNMDNNYYHLNVDDFTSSEIDIIDDILPLLNQNITTEIYDSNFGYDLTNVEIIRPLNNLNIESSSLGYNNINALAKGKINDLINLIITKINS